MKDRGYFACCLRAARLAGGLQQRELAHLLKVTQHNVAEAESGRVALQESTMARYARALGLTLPDLVSPAALEQHLAELEQLDLDDVPTANGVRFRLRQEIDAVIEQGKRWLSLRKR
jgi:transcriptional regulator with XRE-family HTH domain